MSQRAKVLVGGVVVAGLAAAGIALVRSGGDEAVREVADAAPAGEGPRAVAAPGLAPRDPDAPATLGGAVRDAMSSEALAGVEVLFLGGGEVAATSGEDGRFEVTLSPGSYAVSVATEELVSLRPVTLLVAPGARLSGIDVAVVATARVSGRVVDGDGNPLGAVDLGCAATLAGDVVGPGGDRAPCAAASSADGAFSIAVPPGRVELSATAPDRPPAELLLRWVEPGAQLSGVELVLDHPARVTGTLVDAGGAPVTEGAVTAWRGDRVVGRAAVSDAGFALAPLPAGALRLIATAPGHGESAPLAVELAAGDERAVTLALSEVQRIRGVTVDEAGAPIGGARVEIRVPGTEVAVATATSGADGRFEVTGLARGPYDAFAAKPGFAPALRTAVGASLDELRLALARGGGIAGAVTANGAPRQDFSVRLADHTPREGGARAPLGPALRFASPDGSYRIDGLAPGRYRLVISSTGFAPVTLAGVDVPSGGDADGSAALVGGAEVAGRVVDGQTHRPIFGVLVALSTGHEGEVAYTDGDGHYRVDDVAPGRRSVSFSHPSYVGRIESAIELATGDRRAVDVELQPRESSAVDEPGGEPIEFAGIGAALRWRDDRLWVQDVLPRGPAEIAGLEPGDELVEIDGVATRGRGLGASIEDIRGVAGTSVRLRVARGDAEPFVLDIVRATVRYTGGE